MDRMGLTHVYTGDGKGKTTAALGLGLRAVGRGHRVLVVQFLKSSPTGELEAIGRLAPLYRVHRGTMTTKFTWQMDAAELAAARVVQNQILGFAEAEIAAGACDLLVLDEVLGALGAGLIDLQRVVALVRNKPRALELVLTGRNAPPELVELADYVSEIRGVKHPYHQGVAARVGVEH